MKTMKYIDAEPLLKEINHIEEEARKVRVSGTDKEAIGADGKIKLSLKLKSIIDSLLMERQKADLENEIEQCWQSWLSPSNQSSVEGVLPKSEFSMYARHFFELGIRRAAEMYDEIEYNRQKEED